MFRVVLKVVAACNCALSATSSPQGLLFLLQTVSLPACSLSSQASSPWQPWALSTETSSPVRFPPSSDPRLVSAQLPVTAVGGSTPLAPPPTENFLLTDKTDKAKLKATDFGLSMYHKQGMVRHDADRCVFQARRRHRFGTLETNHMRTHTHPAVGAGCDPPRRSAAVFGCPSEERLLAAHQPSWRPVDGWHGPPCLSSSTRTTPLPPPPPLLTAPPFSLTVPGVR